MYLARYMTDSDAGTPASLGDLKDPGDAGVPVSLYAMYLARYMTKSDAGVPASDLEFSLKCPHTKIRCKNVHTDYFPKKTGKFHI